jgi:FtsP/CotA-like multicopper oxidase with cupredoxin domain
VTGDAAPNRTVHLQGRPSLHGVDWRIDGHAHHQADPVRVGDLQVWDVINQTKMDHPFHLHGFFFQVLQINGTPPPFRSWEDTINVPAKGQVRIAWLPDDRPGSWMYHCDILEHHAAGMMAHFEVVS